MSDRDSMEETKDRHMRYLRALNNPVRREIIRAIQVGHNTVVGIQAQTNLDSKTLAWHLQILEWGECVEKGMVGEIVRYRVTQEGRVVDYTDK